MTFDDQDKPGDDLPQNPWASNEDVSEKPSSKKDVNKSDTNIRSLEHRRNQKNQSQNNNAVDDFFEKIQDLWNKKKNSTSGGIPPLKAGVGGILLIVVAFLVLVGFWLSSGFYRVQEGELAVVLRFGEVARISQPGLRYRLPSPIEVELIRNVAVLNKIDGGLKGDTGRSSTDAQEQNLILTGDENMVHTNYTVLWKIKDISEFLFTMRDPEGTIRVAAESSIREVLGQTTARLALTEGRETIGSKSQDLLQKILDIYKAGVQIVSVQLQRVEPPIQVVQAFNDMQASLVDADRLRNEAEAYRNDKLPRARGRATEILRAAEGYQQQIVAQARGEVSRFNAIASAYRLNPEITMRRYYLETMQKVLSRANKTIVGSGVAGGKGTGLVPYINLHPHKAIESGPKAAVLDEKANEVTSSASVNTEKGKR
ncbi:FtsH protease activity modulator HflK [Candidatus Finniella inopinata]|uniref:Protein HflK n=1 Tax=Candidatus Finniella inopinata TaxID=1696036 RepID=A0A4Q7DK29_9PROT|nr:FtsH protease activity modulator HflK [Candidatus Finniella inopinata]RZI46404.1 FtsH protease activity modulator HflK [Candidatus Finniella inopinata]